LTVLKRFINSCGTGFLLEHLVYHTAAVAAVILIETPESTVEHFALLIT